MEDDATIASKPNFYYIVYDVNLSNILVKRVFNFIYLF